MRDLNPDTSLCHIATQIFRDVISTGDLDLADRLIDPEFVDHWAVSRGAPSGLMGFKAGLSMIRAAFPDWTSTPDELVAEGNKVAAMWTVRGTHQGPFMGIASTGKAITMQEAGILSFKNGKLIEIKRVADELALLRQLGVVPSP